MKKSILCIEDSATFVKLLRTHLENQQHDVHIAVDGETGMKMAEDLQPDLILLDLMLPGMTGYEVCTAIRKHPDLASTRIIMLTGKDKMEDVWSGMELGANDYIPKTHPMPKLLAMLDDRIKELAD
jgi:DNA-binding response OmpR family regulator